MSFGTEEELKLSSENKFSSFRPFRPRSHSEGFVKLSSGKIAKPPRVRSNSFSDNSLIRNAVKMAFEEAPNGQISQEQYQQLAHSFKIPVDVMIRKCQNVRHYLEKKTREAMIKLKVTDINSPSISEIATQFDLNVCRVKECFYKYYEKIREGIAKMEDGTIAKDS